jgi:transglutaminase-like putative cysteine protease
MQYTIRHVTRFTYEAPISQSVMEARMQPATDASQRCIRFGLSTTPPSRVKMYQDHDGNIVHHFNIPGRHSRLTVTAEAIVDCLAPEPRPAALGAAAWVSLDDATRSGRFWDELNASPFAHRTPLLDQFADEIGLARGDDPECTLKRTMADVHRRIAYSPKSTRVDSPIDDALSARRGVCQDFAHVMIALVRRLGIPCRYVSGYLFQRPDGAARSVDGATHAWVEAWVPGLEWVGFDPAHDTTVGERHIRVAVGRDYADVPPTRGVFKGSSAMRSELAVAVSIGSGVPGFSSDATPFVPWMSREASAPLSASDSVGVGQQQRLQQQQQQQ